MTRFPKTTDLSSDVGISPVTIDVGVWPNRHHHRNAWMCVDQHFIWSHVSAHSSSR